MGKGIFAAMELHIRRIRGSKLGFRMILPLVALVGQLSVLSSGREIYKIVPSTDPNYTQGLPHAYRTNTYVDPLQALEKKFESEGTAAYIAAKRSVVAKNQAARAEKVAKELGLLDARRSHEPGFEMTDCHFRRRTSRYSTASICPYPIDMDAPEYVAVHGVNKTNEYPGRQSLDGLCTSLDEEKGRTCDDLIFGQPFHVTAPSDVRGNPSTCVLTNSLIYHFPRLSYITRSSNPY